MHFLLKKIRKDEWITPWLSISSSSALGFVYDMFQSFISFGALENKIYFTIQQWFMTSWISILVMPLDSCERTILHFGMKIILIALCKRNENYRNPENIIIISCFTKCLVRWSTHFSPVSMKRWQWLLYRITFFIHAKKNAVFRRCIEKLYNSYQIWLSSLKTCNFFINDQTSNQCHDKIILRTTMNITQILLGSLASYIYV